MLAVDRLRAASPGKVRQVPSLRGDEGVRANTGTKMASEQLKEIVQFLREQNLKVPVSPTVEQIRAHADRIYDKLEIPKYAQFIEESEVPGLWTQVPEAPRNQAILYLHGGGYVMHSPKQYRPLTAALSQASGRKVFAVDYRRAPEAPFPAALEDALDAYLWLIEELGEEPEIVVGGDSAGGGLAVALMLLCKKVGVLLPKGVFLISPWLDLTMSGESIQTKASVDPIVSLKGLEDFSRSYLGKEGNPTEPLASPLFGDLEGLPPVLVHVGSNEALLDDSTRFARSAGAAGVEVSLKVWPEMFHEWHIWHSRLPEGRAANEEAAEFIRRRFEASDSRNPKPSF